MKKTNNAVAVLIVEDDVVLRERLVEVVNSAGDLQVAAAFGLVQQSLEWLDGHTVKLALIDLGLPDGHGSKIIQRCSDTGIDSLVLTSLGDEKNVTAALQAGATGYLLKDTDDTGVVVSIKQVLNGESPINPRIARYVLSRFSPRAVREKRDGDLVELSSRETEVLGLIARGDSYKEVGSKLNLSINTVRTHIRRCYQKLGVNSRNEAVFRASQEKIISI